MKTFSIPVVSALIVIVIALLGLLGYVPGMELLGSIEADYIPMAPSTAVSFVILGFILVILNTKKTSTAKTTIPITLALLVAIFGILEVAGYLTGMDLNFEDTIVPTAGTLQGIPIARMSPATGAAFSLSGVGIVFYILTLNFHKGNRYMEYSGGGLGILVLFISFVFCLAYLYGNPLLYEQSTTIPMALTTALGFLFLSFSMLSSKNGTFPMNLFTGSTTRSYMLRFIFPLSTLSVILGGIVVFSSTQIFRINPAFITAAMTLLIALITGFIAALISRQLGSKIDKSEEALKERNEELNTFIYRSSHDLRAPLSSILGLINMSQLELMDAESVKTFALIKDRILVQDRILTELLRVSGIYNKEMKPRLIDPAEEVMEIINSLENSEAAKNVKFILKDEYKKKIKLDRTLFISIIQNIVSNAIAYKNISIRNPHVHLELAGNGNNIDITIKDNGIGIPKDIQPKIFDMFYRGHESSKGSGLGLYIVKKSVAKLNGKITMTSELKKGTTLHLIFPEM